MAQRGLEETSSSIDKCPEPLLALRTWDSVSGEQRRIRTQLTSSDLLPSCACMGLGDLSYSVCLGSADTTLQESEEHTSTSTILSSFTS